MSRRRTRQQKPQWADDPRLVPVHVLWPPRVKHDFGWREFIGFGVRWNKIGIISQTRPVGIPLLWIRENSEAAPTGVWRELTIVEVIGLALDPTPYIEASEAERLQYEASRK